MPQNIPELPKTPEIQISAEMQTELNKLEARLPALYEQKKDFIRRGIPLKTINQTIEEVGKLIKQIKNGEITTIEEVENNHWGSAFDDLTDPELFKKLGM